MFDLVKKIADAVLYEGYLLYPYRASAVKNRQRFNWGALVPESYAAVQRGTENAALRIECPAVGARPAVGVKVRFLQLVEREIGRFARPVDELPENLENVGRVPYLEIDGEIHQAWQEAVECELDLPPLELAETGAREIDFVFPAGRETEPLRDAGGRIAGVVIRTRETLKGRVLVQSSKIERQNSEPVFKIAVEIANTTPFEDAAGKNRDAALLRSTVSTHAILSIENGRFVSLLDPPEEFRALVAGCRNTGAFPVLAGPEGATDCLLAAPIILYDYPRIAAESAGDLFDGTEIDEILSLRIMTLTDAEKREMRSVDERARRLLERTETMPEEFLTRLHGVMKSAGGTHEERER
ncbi:MAG: hypothetical protein JSS81_16980 [Acidobacteria bacterium]|nr:hypothetical protein [Acidobacteriota bacterium]